MSRTLRFVVAAIAVAGGLTLAAPNVEAAEMGTQAPDFWSLALDWITDLWKENVVDHPEGGQSSVSTSDQGLLIDPNG